MTNVLLIVVMAATIGSFLAKNEDKRRELEARPFRNFSDNTLRQNAIKYINQCNLLGAVCMKYIFENSIVNISHVENEYKTAYSYASTVTEMWPYCASELKKLQKFIVSWHNEDHDLALRQLVEQNPMIVIRRFTEGLIQSIRSGKPIFQMRFESAARNIAGIEETATMYGLKVDLSNNNIEMWLNLESNVYAENADLQFAMAIRGAKRNYRYYFFGSIIDNLVRSTSTTVLADEQTQIRLTPLITILQQSGLKVTPEPGKLVITL